MSPMQKNMTLSFSIFCKTGLLSVYVVKIGFFRHSRANFSMKTTFFENFYFAVLKPNQWQKKEPKIIELS